MSRYVIAMYIRLSMEDVKTDSLSIPNQRLLLGRHIDTLEQNDVEVLEFVDNGYSGVNFERPAVQELLELVRQSKIDCIIVKDFSRFGRNSIETGYFIEQVFPLFHTRFISVSDNFDSNDYKEDTGGMAVAFKYLMHEYYSLDLSRKTKSAKYTKMRRGEYQSVVCCYGYKKGADGRLEIDEEAATVVRRIFMLALETKNAQEIVKALYADGIPTPGEYRAAKGKGFHDISRCAGIWQRSAVLRILTDERYIGTYIMGKRTLKEVGGKRSRLNDESEWIKIPNHHPAIIEKAVYEQVQAKLLHFKCDKHNREYILRGKIVCGCCLHSMQRALRKEAAFVCRYTKVDALAPCHGMEIKERELETLLFDIISKQAQVILNTDSLNDINQMELRSEQQAEYRKLISRCQDNKRSLYEQYVMQEIDAGQYAAQKAGLDTELNRLNRVYTTLSAQVAKLKADCDEKNKAREIAGDIAKETGLTQALMDLLIDKVYIYPGNRVEISWKVTDFSDFQNRRDTHGEERKTGCHLLPRSDRRPVVAGISKRVPAQICP
jgi:site-specific DNA recombinase